MTITTMAASVQAVVLSGMLSTESAMYLLEMLTVLSLLTSQSMVFSVKFRL